MLSVSGVWSIPFGKNGDGTLQAEAHRNMDNSKAYNKLSGGCLTIILIEDTADEAEPEIGARLEEYLLRTWSLGVRLARLGRENGHRVDL